MSAGYQSKRKPRATLDWPYLYVAKFSNGSVKFGITLRPANRQRELAKHVGHIARFHIFGRVLRVQGGSAAEIACIRAASLIGTVAPRTKELFRGVEFEQALAIGRKARGMYQSTPCRHKGNALREVVVNNFDIA